jgi:GNAT superfamily N-acetyltransferase
MADVRLRIARCLPEDLPAVGELAGTIWRQHYPGIITHEQIEYMLPRMYSVEALSEFLRASDAGLALAHVGDRLAGFAAWYRPDEPATTKLDKLYVLPELHGHGVGRRLIAHVEEAARAAGAATLVLNVNKRNVRSIAFYERCGFATREAVVVDIGGGFVMDDYVMAKVLRPD